MSKNITAMLTSNSDEYVTPDWLFNELNNEFHFTLDPAANIENAKCNKFYSKDDNGLIHSWKGERVFCNPPYSNIGEWVKKAWEESRNENTIVALVIPTRTDTQWFNDYILYRSEIRFIKGRLKFNGMKTNAPFPSMVVIFRGAKIRNTYQEFMKGLNIDERSII